MLKTLNNKDSFSGSLSPNFIQWILCVMKLIVTTFSTIQVVLLAAASGGLMPLGAIVWTIGTHKMKIPNQIISVPARLIFMTRFLMVLATKCFLISMIPSLPFPIFNVIKQFQACSTTFCLIVKIIWFKSAKQDKPSRQLSLLN